MIMHRLTKYKKTKKAIALTLAVSMLNASLFPTYTLALNPGAGLPEYSSFEPVDATDMVSLLTGDFTYSMPVINVPGPEGGYPLAMFYHAGITPEQEASWLGLGWNINPGSINRFAKGIPDDFNRKTSVVSTYSGITTVKDWDVSLGVGYGGFSVGLSLDGGSHKSTGGSVSFGVGQKSGPLSGGFSVGSRGVNVSAQYGFSQNSGVLSASAGISEKGSLRGTSSIGVSKVGSIGVSLSSSGVNSFASMAGHTENLSGTLNNQNLSMNPIGGFSFYANFYYGNVSVNYTKIEYAQYARDDKTNTGSLYMSQAKNEITSTGGVQKRLAATDVYEDPYSASTYNSVEAQSKENALTFPSYDSYNVTAQGLSGNISPKIFEFGTLTHEGMVFSGAATELQCYNDSRLPFNKDADKIYFQFDNEPGGFAKINPGTYGTGASPMEYSYSGGDLDITNDGKSFYNSTSKRVGQGKYIEWFTNGEIYTQFNDAIAKGFIETESQSGHRNEANLYDSEGIGAYSITTEDGKTYHYSIPVYEFESHQIFEDKTSQSNGAHLINHKINKYAYDWLLTSVTGPDYVDRGTSGVIDDEDYGYWVKFDYGKWTDGYQWRYPYKDGTYVPNNSSKSSQYGEYEIGRKQIYYLNSIKTKTHTAYFIKSLREDGKGKQVTLYKEAPVSGWYHSSGGESECSGIENRDWVKYDRTYTTQINSCGVANQLLKLDKIILMNNADAVLNPANNGTNVFKASVSGGGTSCVAKKRQKNYYDENASWTINGDRYRTCSGSSYLADISLYNIPTYTSYFQANVLDVKDVEDDIADIEEKALKVVQFSQDYSLCGNTPNSDATATNPSSTAKGKLTLNSVKIYGLGKADILPSYNFTYNNQSSNPIAYNQNQIDNWGYYSTVQDDYSKKPNADAWSLNEITTPLGGKIKINYESDTYSLEAALGSIPEFNRRVTNITKNGTSMTFKVDQSVNDLKDNGALVINKLYKIYAMTAASYRYGPPRNPTNVPAKYEFIYKKLLSFDLNANTLTFEETSTSTFPNPLNVYFTADFLCGGGIRVKEILLDDGAGGIYKTSYSYNNPATNISSGVTSYAPIVGGGSTEPYIRGVTSPITVERYIPYVYELPAPMVMYEYVTVEDKGLTNDSYAKARYKFDVLKTAINNSSGFSMGDHVKVNDVDVPGWFQSYTTGNHWGYSYRRSGIVTDNKAAIGRILEITTLNKSNLVSDKNTYEYQKISDGSIKSGIIQESFNTINRYIRWKPDHVTSSSDWHITSSSRISYPSLLKSITTESNGIKNTITNTKYDFYSGMVTETESVNSYGEKYRTKTIPAYEKYGGIDNSAMGSKVYDVSNKNMLVQGTANYSYSVDAGNAEHLLSASVQTWKANPWTYSEFNTGTSSYGDVTTGADVWRKYQNYVWKSAVNTDGTIAGTFTDFDWSGTPNSGWQKTNEITRYDHYSNPIESKDINGNYAAIKTGGLNDNFVIATSGASNYRSFVFTGFEDSKNVAPTGSPAYYFGGEVYLNEGVKISSAESGAVTPHTGNFLAHVPATKYGPIYKVSNGIQTGQTYRASAWVHKNSPSSTVLVAELDGQSVYTYQSMAKNDSKAIAVGDWLLLTVNITVPANYVASGGSHGLNDLRVYVYNPASNDEAYVDDMRLQPVNSPVSGFVFDDHTGLLMAILDNENFATIFTYDAAGRLIKTEKEYSGGIKKVSEASYHYGRGL
ncbi:MAG: hypothetical protein HYU69_05460 [Bacteroidetes bacterium]|nr:hypothetical protein [Bacteroidota bacterium]